MNQTVYILSFISLQWSFYLTSAREGKTTAALTEQLLKDQAFRDSIKEKSKRPTITMSSIPSTKTIDWKPLLAKEITEKLK